MRALSLLTLTGLCAIAPIATADAHFIWVVAEPNAEASLHFSEGPYELTAARLRDRLAGVRVQAGGADLALTTTARGPRAALPADAGGAVATMRYGLFTRGEPFLLEYYARGAASLAAAAQPSGLRAEVLAVREGDAVRLRVRFDDAPVAGAEVVISWPDRLEPETLQADEAGELVVPLPAEGLLGIRSHAEEQASGEHDGEAYGLVKHYTTLTVSLDGADAIPAGADASAWRLLQRASLLRATLPAATAELEGELVLVADGAELTGAFHYVVGEGLARFELSGDDEDLQAWARRSVESMIVHRLRRPFRDGDGAKVVTFADETPGPLGETLALDGGMGSRYRVEDGRLVSVERAGARARFAITVLESATTEAGKVLSQRYVVVHREPESGGITRVDAVSETFDQRSGSPVPEGLRVVTHGPAGQTVRTLSLEAVEVR